VTLKAVIIAILYAGACLPARGATGPELAVLHQPATHSARSLNAATLAVTRAGNRLVAVGERGVVLLSDDSGVQWRQAKVPVSVSLTAVQFVDPRVGWAVGHLGVVLHTEDGGETWTKQFDGTEAAALALEAAQRLVQSASPPTPEAEKALADAELLVEDGPDKPFLDLYFLNADTGFIVGAYNLIFRTDDGGKTWQPLLTQVENPDSLHFYGIRAIGKTLFLAGEQGTLLKSTDGGASFKALEAPYEGSYFGLITTQQGAILVYGLRGNAFRSEDEGSTWQRVESGVSAGLSAGIELPDNSVVLAAQSGEVLVSHDDGRSFEHLPVKESFPLAAIAQAPDKTLVVASLNGVKRLNLDAGAVP
jgi:photosystem II stability/assembly factor-like uncharacterized protein